MEKKRKLKIAFLSFYSGEVSRGVETYVHELSNKLVELGHEIVVYQNGPERINSKYKTVSVGFPIDWNQKGIEGRFLGIAFTDYYVRLIGKFTWKILKELNPNIDVLVTTNGSLQVLYGRVWSLINRVKHVVAGQSGPGADDRWNLWCFPNTFVGMTKYHCDWAKRANPLVKIAKIANGVDLNKFRQNTKPLKIGLPRPIVLSVAALEEGKRIDLLVRAVGKLNKTSLLLVGRGKLENKLQQLGDSLLKDRFKIISLPFESMPSVYNSCDLFSYPTVPWESFGIVMLEAMASGLPVVAADDPIRREIVGDAGIFVDPTNADKYAETLKKALKLKWGSKPRRQAMKFNWDDIAKQYEELFLKL